MAITTEQVKQLRDETGISVMQCKKALEEAGGDMDKARVILKKQSKAAASKKADRTLGAGLVRAYVHTNNTVGAMLVLSCETDFVSNNAEFDTLAREIAMHAAAMNPEFISRNDVSEKDKEAAKSVFADELKGKPENLHDKILGGKLDAYFAERVLLEQPFIKNPDQTIGEMIDGAIQKFGEKIEVTKLVRFEV